MSTDTVCFSSPENTNQFTFDRIYGEDSSQEDLFQDVKPIVHAVLNGYNGTVLAYGQTGSGKTHTLLGAIDDQVARGIVPRAVRELAHGITTCTSGCSFKVTLTVHDIANEFDLRYYGCLAYSTARLSKICPAPLLCMW